MMSSLQRNQIVWAKKDEKWSVGMLTELKDENKDVSHFDPKRNGELYLLWLGDGRISQIKEELVKDFTLHFTEPSVSTMPISTDAVGVSWKSLSKVPPPSKYEPLVKMTVLGSVLGVGVAGAVCSYRVGRYSVHFLRNTWGWFR